MLYSRRTKECYKTATKPLLQLVGEDLCDLRLGADLKNLSLCKASWIDAGVGVVSETA